MYWPPLIYVLSQIPVQQILPRGCETKQNKKQKKDKRNEKTKSRVGSEMKACVKSKNLSENATGTSKTKATILALRSFDKNCEPFGSTQRHQSSKRPFKLETEH